MNVFMKVCQVDLKLGVQVVIHTGPCP